MVLRILLFVCYAIRPIGDHPEVRHSSEFIVFSHGPLTTYLGYMSSQGTIVCSPATFRLYRWCRLPSGRTLQSIFRLGQVNPSLLADPWRKCLRQTLIPTASVVPDVPLEEYQFCIFQRWRTGEVVVTSLTLLYGVHFAIAQCLRDTANPFLT